MEVAILLYDNVTALDAVGPFEVFRLMPGARVRLVAAAPGPVRTDAGPRLLNADRTFDEVPRPDLLLVPGSADNAHVLGDEQTLGWVREAHRHSRWTASVCTGSLVLGAAGLLRGLRASTHWAYREELRKFGAEPAPDRVVREGKVVTAAGVSAGIDMALTVAALEHGATVAQGIQLGIEYDPQPPFDAGSEAKAPRAVVGATLARLRAARGREA